MKLCITFTVIGLLISAAAAQPATTQPIRVIVRPSPTTAPAVDPETRKILDAMEAAGKTVKTVRADLSYKAFNTSMGDEQYRTGWVAYQSKQLIKIGEKTITKSPMFRVHFDTVKMGKGKTISRKVDYAYDGKNLTVSKAKNKTITRFQLPPNSNADDVMQLGKGPMPIPFGQKTADMVKYFVCTTLPTRITDPKDTVYLSLVPRKIHAKDLNTLNIHMWISTKTHLPVKIVTKDKAKDNITSTFSKTVINEVIKKDLFTIPKPLGWKLIVQPMKSGQNIKP